MHGQRPFPRDIAVDQEQELARRLRARQCPFRFRDLPESPVVALHGVRGVDQPPDIRWIVKHRCQILPIGFPRADRARVRLPPLLAQFEQVDFGCLARWRLIDRLQVGHKCFPVLPRDVAQAVPYLMDHTALDMRFRKDRLDRRVAAT